MKGLLSKLMKSTEREDFSSMSNNRKLEITRKEILKDISKKEVKGLPRG
jgi:hypothetical protein